MSSQSCVIISVSEDSVVVGCEENQSVVRSNSSVGSFEVVVGLVVGLVVDVLVVVVAVVVVVVVDVVVEVVVGVVVVVDVVVVLVAAALEATVSSPQTFCWNSISDDPEQNHALY